MAPRFIHRARFLNFLAVVYYARLISVVLLQAIAAYSYFQSVSPSQSIPVCRNQLYMLMRHRVFSCVSQSTIHGDAPSTKYERPHLGSDCDCSVS